jgi:hypothetical protein
MIDNPRQTSRLIEELHAALPIPAVMTPELLASLRKESGEPALPARCSVTDIHYLGDEGGIVCRLEIDREMPDRAFFVSITHLRFHPRATLTREIVAYQKHRVKRLEHARRTN